MGPETRKLREKVEFYSVDFLFSSSDKILICEVINAIIIYQLEDLPSLMILCYKVVVVVVSVS